MSVKKRVILSVTNDLTTDQRLHKVCTSLMNSNFEVLLVGRKLRNSKKIKRLYKTKRMSLLFTSGPLFYATYNLKLFFFLLFSRVDYIVSNDLDTLLASYYAAKLKGKALIYDSHELFTEVPELIDRPRVQSLWLRIEQKILPKVQYSYTVSQSIVDYYHFKYGVKMQLIRNFPTSIKEIDVVKENYLIYQGVLNVNRGLEELISAMKYVEGYVLLIAGGGDVEEKLKKQVANLQLKTKVKFLGRLPADQLIAYTKKAKLGFSLEKKKGLNYEYALPNKVFDYLNANVPVLYSDLKEVKATLSGIEIGEELKSYDPQLMAKQIMEILHSPKYEQWIENCKFASSQFNWEGEEKKLIQLYKSITTDKL